MKTKDERKRVVVVDDPNVCATLRGGLENTGWFQVVATCASGEHALNVISGLPAAQRPHLVLLDIKMPGMGGIACCRELRRLFPDLLIAMHTAKPALERFEEARLAGADGYIVKGIAIDQLAEALRHLQRHDGQCLYIAPKEAALSSPAARDANRLTACDNQIMELVHAGLTIKEMAAGLNRHEQTVKKHLRAVRARLSARTVAQALAFWLRK